MAVVAEVYLAGVSTRRVESLVQTLGIERMSKSQVSELAKSLDELVAAFRNRPLDGAPYPYVWLDALTQRCREGGRVVNVATVIATGVNAEGHREILGVDVFTSEDGAGWTAFLRGLVARGLQGVRLVISYAHQGAQGSDRGRPPGRGLAAVARAFSAQPVDPRSQVCPGPRRHLGALHLRPAGCRRGVGSAGGRRRAVAGPLPGGGGLAGGGGPRAARLQQLPQRGASRPHPVRGGDASAGTGQLM